MRVAPAETSQAAAVTAEAGEEEVTLDNTSTFGTPWFRSTSAASSALIAPERSYMQLASEEERTRIGRLAEEHVHQLLVDEPARFTHVEWVNQGGESYKPYDFKVMERGVEKYLEVKGTPSPNKDEAYFSAAEWRFLFEQQHQHAIYRVFDVYQSPRLVVIEYPSAQLVQGELLPASIPLRL